MTHLFTIICQYNGGTFTSQVEAENPADAFRLWGYSFQESEYLLPEERSLFNSALDFSVRENAFVALEGLQNTWYESFTLKRHLLEVTIVATLTVPVESGIPTTVG